MQEEYYNLPMVRENFVSRNLKKLFQGFFNIKRKKRDQKRASILAQRAKLNRNISTDTVAVSGVHQRVDIYEFQAMYRRGEISIENMNEDQKYALIKLFVSFPISSMSLLSKLIDIASICGFIQVLTTSINSLTVL